jgi:AmpD protein
MQLVNHRLLDAFWIPSPNFDERPDPADISLLVIHCISLPPGQFGNDCIDRFFCNRLEQTEHPYFKEIHHLQVSSHLLIERHGAIKQYVAFDKRAWHAGKSSYQGREKCNDFSIGIELEGVESVDYAEAQYQALANVIRVLQKTYPTAREMAAHSAIAPGRKTDPGPLFDWSKLNNLLA